jgi:hypothetical protein
VLLSYHVFFFSIRKLSCFWVLLTSEQRNFSRHHAQKFSFVGVIVLSFLGHSANTLSKGHDGME